MRVWLLAALLAGTAWAQPVGQPPRVELVGRSVTGDIVRYGRPFQAAVDLTVNDLSLNQECRLRVTADDGELASQIPVKLAPGKRSLTLPTTCADYSQALTLDGVPGLKPNVNMGLVMASDQDFLALTLSPRKNQFSYLGGYKSLLKSGGEFRLNQPRPGPDLPDLWWTYLGHDAVVLHDLPNLKLSDRTEQALLLWTQAGGSLVLVTNLDTAELSESAFGPKAPLQPRAVERHGVPMLVGSYRPEEVELRHHSAPLLLRRSYGAGVIWQVTAAVDTQDVLGTAVTSKLWQKLTAEQPGLTFRKMAFERSRRLSVLPELPGPATAALAWYLAGYVLVVIPGIYIYLRRKDQVLRLIVVVPVVSTLITVGAYYSNASGRGRELIQRELGLAWLRGGQTQAVLDQTAVLFSPSPLKMSLDFEPQTLLRPNSLSGRDLRHVMTCRGEQLQLEPERLPQWGLSRWNGFGVRQLPGPLSLQQKLQGSRWRVSLDNRTGLSGKAVLLCENNRCGSPVDLKSGRQELEVEVGNLQDFSDTLTRLESILATDEAGRLGAQIEPLRQGRPVLVCLVDDPLFSVLHPVGLKPKVWRRTLLVVSEDGR